MDRETVLDLIPAYALGALDPEDRAAVDALLATDAEAQRLLAEYQAITDNLVLTTPTRRAPPNLTQDLQRRLAAQRPAASVPVPPAPQLRTETPEIQVVKPRSIAWVMALAAALVVIVAGLLLTRGTSAPGPAQLYEQIAALPDALHVPVTPDLQASTNGDMVVSPDGKQAVIRVVDLPDIQSDQTFELWLVDEQGARSAGLLQFADEQGTNYISVPLEKDARDYAAFAVSIEPSGGSPTSDSPTGPKAFVVAVPA